MVQKVDVDMTVTENAIDETLFVLPVVVVHLYFRATERKHELIQLLDIKFCLVRNVYMYVLTISLVRELSPINQEWLLY